MNVKGYLELLDNRAIFRVPTIQRRIHSRDI
jgi:hypothetical protein